MSSHKWMPFYVGDFLADTMHLGATETGIYVRLILHCWQHGGTIPRDNHQLALIAHCDARLWWQYAGTVLQFFDVVDASTMQQKRVSTELRRSAEISNKRKGAALQKHMQTPSKKDANAHTRARALQSHIDSSLEESQSAPPSVDNPRPSAIKAPPKGPPNKRGWNGSRDYQSPSIDDLRRTYAKPKEPSDDGGQTGG